MTSLLELSHSENYFIKREQSKSIYFAARGNSRIKFKTPSFSEHDYSEFHTPK